MSEARILVVDDEYLIRWTLQQNLAKEGYEVILAESGEEALVKIKEEAPDIVLLDIKMPGMSGNDFLKYVKDNMKLSVPIIAMSGTPWLFENSSFDAVIAKPFSKEDLLTVISQFIQPPQL